MSTRMERYGNNLESDSNRSLRNRDLYDGAYEENYSNIEGIVSTPSPNEVDILKLQELIQEKEAEKKRKTQLIKTDVAAEIPELDLFELDKNYDIRDVLVKAKEDKTETREYRKLRNTEYDILKSLKIQNENLGSVGAEQELEELKELMHTLTSKHDLKKLGNTDLSLHLLDDLKGEKESASIKAVIDEANRQDEEEKKPTEEMELDKSFYTNSGKFKIKDFTDAAKDEKEKKTNNIIRWILIGNFVLLITAVIYIIFFNN